MARAECGIKVGHFTLAGDPRTIACAHVPRSLVMRIRQAAHVAVTTHVTVCTCHGNWAAGYLTEGRQECLSGISPVIERSMFLKITYRGELRGICDFSHTVIFTLMKDVHKSMSNCALKQASSIGI